MRLVFRADGSGTIGFGHLSRVVSLARAARAAACDVVVVSADPDASVASFVSRDAVPLTPIAVTPGSAEDAEATRAVAGPDALLVVDGYRFSGSWLGQLAGDGRLIAYIDDLAREPLACAAVINPNVSGTRSLYGPCPQTHFFVGPHYAIVDRRFVDARGQKPAPGPSRRLLVTMGGSDPGGATLVALDAIGPRPELEVRVVVGGSNRHRAAIEAGCAKHGFEVRFAVDDMAREMLWADIAITASGVTSTELACVGVPGVTFPIVDNQEPIAAALAELGLYDVLGPRPTSHSIRAALDGLLADGERRRAMFDAQRLTIDGGGAERLVSELLALKNNRDTRKHGGDLS